MGKLWCQPNKHIRGNKNPNWRGGKILRVCKICNKIFFVSICQPNRQRGIYCSKECFYKRHKRKMIDKRGYVHVFIPKRGYIREHRFVMENKLGRPLRKEEIVHHKNNIFSDNRPENLEVFRNQSQHIFYHHRNKTAQ